MKKVCLCLAFVLAAVCILCSCSDLPNEQTTSIAVYGITLTIFFKLSPNLIPEISSALSILAPQKDHGTCFCQISQ